MKKKFTLLMMLAFLGFGIGAAKAQTNWGGSGTEANPYTISDIAGLEELAQKVNSSQSQSGKYFELTCDLVFPDDYGNWTPIGNVYNYGNRGFCGCFDGGGHVIRNLTIINPDADSGNGWCAALFGDVGSAVIRNIGLVDVNIRIESNYTGRVAGICAYQGLSGGSGTLTIENCFVTGIIDAPNSYSVAGILADLRFSAGLVRNCFNLATITGSGLVARNFNTLSITNCYNAGIVSTVVNEESNITNCYNIGCSSARFGSVSSNCYVDKQMCTYGAEQTGVIRQLTSELLGPSIPLGADDWVYVDGLYPQLKVFAESTNPLIRAASLVSVTPVYLNSADNVDAVGVSPFTVCTGNEVSWASTGTVSLAGNTASFNQSGDAVLTVSKTVEGVVVSKEIPMYTALCWDGSGTEADPYQIVDADGLVCLAEKVNAGNSYAGIYFKQTADIDLSSVCGEGVGNWTPIGTSSHSFKGVFDGDGKTISNLYININAPDKRYQGLFGYVEDAEINGVVLKSSSIVVLGNSSYYSAGICGYSLYSNFSDCINYANVIGNDVAGICAYIKGATDDLCEVKNCYNYGSVECRGKSYDAGGVLGDTQYAEVTLCVNEGKVSYAGEDSELSDGSLGGICSEANDINIVNCINKGDVLGSMDKGPEFAGGIVGDFNSYEVENVISGCKNFGSITGMLSGGISSLSDGYYSSCINKGIVTGQIAGGIAGMIEGSGIRAFTDCDNHGNVIGEQMAAGIVLTHEDGTITNCTNYGNVKGKDMGAAGIVGMVSSVAITNCRNFGTIECEPDVITQITISDIVDGNIAVSAGIVGLVNGNSTVSFSANFGSVKNGHTNGGICGMAYWHSSGEEGHPILDRCMNLGPIEGNAIFSMSGGIVGNCWQNGSGLLTNDIWNCYNAGMVFGCSVSGGIAGYSEYGLRNCYNVGNVYVTPCALMGGVQYKAGIVGILTDDYDPDLEPQVINCYYDKQMCTAENMYYFAEDFSQILTPNPVAPTEGQNLLTATMTNSWNPLGDAFVAGTNLYPQLTVFAGETASLVSVTPAFLANEENVDHVTRNFTVGTGNDVEWSHVSGNEVMSFSGANVTVSGTGTEIVAVSKDDISKCIQMTTEVSELCWAGSGTEADPYRIEDAAGLVCLAENVNAGESYAGVYFKMMNDIDLSSVCGESVGNWTPIGKYYKSNASIENKPFSGYFDGDSHVISNLYINTSEAGSYGLFGYANNATISNVTLDDSEVTDNNSEDNSSYYAGGICAFAFESSFIECTNNGVIRTTKGAAAGICSQIKGTDSRHCIVRNCSNTGSVTAVESDVEAGGILGRVQFAEIYDCSNSGDIILIGEEDMSDGMIGGICGQMSNSHLVNCHNTGNIATDLEIGCWFAGGIVADLSEDESYEFRNKISESYNEGSVTGFMSGGICSTVSGTIVDCHNLGNIYGTVVGGIAGGGLGESNPVSIRNSYNSGSVTSITSELAVGFSDAGGIVAYLSDADEVIGCHNSGEVSAHDNVGGIVGSTEGEGAIIDKCYNYGRISGGLFIGGVIGYGEHQTLTNSFNLGQIDGQVGNAPATVAGGVIGGSYSGHVADCYNAGMVSGYGVAGGVAGVIQFHNEDFDYDGENLYNVGQVTCVPIYNVDLGEGPLDFNYRAGISLLAYESKINNCYYDKQMCTAAEPTVQYSNSGGTAGGTATNCAAMLTSAMTNGSWIPGGSAFTVSNGLYPQLTAFVESENDIDNEASLVSVRPMFLAETDNVDHVYTSPFTVGIDDDEEWSHVSGEELLTFNADGTVEWEDYGTETVAVTNMTHDFITKQIKLTTANAENVTWVDWVTEAPSGFNPANIDSPEDLAWFISYVNGFNDCEVHADADAMITADIDMSAHYWVPIGFYCGNICTEHQITYTGKFLGNFHNIDGIRVDWNALVNSPVLQTLAPVSSGKQNRDGNDYLGMFGSICNDTIVHVFVTSGSIVGDEDYDGGGMGGLVGCAEGSVIWNCYSNASVFQNAGSSKGGLVGVAKVYSGDDKGDDGDGEGVPTVITGSSCTADITGNGEMGGILGWSKGAVIRDCYANVKFTIQDNFGSKGHEFNSQVGCLVGASGKGFVEIYNSYVRMRGYEIIERGGGEEQAHCVGMIIGEAQGETIDHCYVPADSPYGYVGRSENVKEVFAQVPFDDGSKGDDPIFRLSVKNGGHSYYLMSLDDATDAVFQNCEQVDIEGDTYEIFEPNEEDGHLYIYNDGFDYSFYNSREGYLAVDGEGQLTYSDATPVLWNVEPNDTYGSFKLYTTPEAEQLYLGMKDGHFGVFAQGTEGCNFDIYAFMSIQMASEANIQNCGKFATTVYPYTYANPEGGNIITLDGDDDEIVESGKTTLLDALNNWDLYHSGDEDISVSMDWARFGSALNGDYPVHCYYNPDNLTEGDAVKPTAKVITTPDKTNGFPFRFYSHVGDALNYYNNLENGGILCVYGSDDMSGAAVQSNDNDVDVYVNGMTYMKCPMNEDASKDWYVSLLQGSGSTLNVHSGFYLDNSDASGEVGGGTDDWHMVSSPLAHVPVGIVYEDETQHPYMTPASCMWDGTKDGLFPTDAPLDSYDFYAYSEPDYHWINLKQNSASHYHQDDGNEPIEYENDTELTAGHGYLIAMDKEVFMQTSGTLNNGDIEVPVTYSGAHNKGLNFLGNPYLSSLDFDKFATENGSLWEGGAYAESYITLDADKKGYITYAKGQSENPEGLSRYVWPNQGFYIAADNAGTATFTNAMRVIKTDAASYFRGEEQPNYALVNLKATDSEGNRDMLTVELGRPEVGGARKERNVRNGNGLLYSHYQGGDYSVVFTEEGASQVPVWFESREDDTYTMTWSTYNGTFSYLHLIDNLTGADVDMLANAEYRYASASSDYASRFRLVFAYTGIGEEESEGEGQFVFQSGDELVVTGEGEVDIIDLNGRVIRHSRATGTQTAIAMPAVARGIYMVRLTSANGVKVNKIVVR